MDLVKCIQHLGSMPNLDLNNAVAAGASYGGYMMNWIQGQPLGRKVSQTTSRKAHCLSTTID